MKKSLFLIVVALVNLTNAHSQDTADLNSIGCIPGIYADSSLPKLQPMEYINPGGISRCALAVSVAPTKGMYVYGIAAPLCISQEYYSDSLWHWAWNTGEHVVDYPIDTTYDNCFEYFQFYKKVASRGDTVEFAVLEQGMVHVLDTNVIGYIDRGADIQWFQRRYLPIRAIYFDQPIYVEDTFYIGFTNYNQRYTVQERTWSFKFFDYGGGNYTTTQRSFYKVAPDKNVWIDYHSTPSVYNSHTYYYNYFYIFPMVEYVPMYPSPLVTGGEMAGAPVLTVENFVSVAPNPATESATIASSFPLEAVELYDLGGSLLLRQPCSGLSLSLDLRPFPSGTYILKAKTRNGTATKKLIKQ